MKITDEKLYQLCKIYGERARFWRQKFIGLLPEVFKRELYKKHGFSSIFEFSAKLAGVSEEQVRRALNLEKRFVDKPILKNLLENGEVSVNKLARVASVATTENQEFWALQAKNLPQNALEVLVKDEKHLQNQNQDANSVRTHTKVQSLFQSSTDGADEITELKLSPEVTQKLLELQRKNIDINQLILSAIQKREQKIENEKEKIAFEQENADNKVNGEAREGGLGQKEKLLSAQKSEKISRYIPKKINKLIQQEYGDKCAIPNCRKNSEQVHHEIPFALLKNHNPYFLKPLCREHHAIAHGINLAYSRLARHLT